MWLSANVSLTDDGVKSLAIARNVEFTFLLWIAWIPYDDYFVLDPKRVKTSNEKATFLIFPIEAIICWKYF